MLMKSSKAADHINRLEDCFLVLNEYGMKLNPSKCTFGVTSGEFLGNSREVQRLTGRIAGLNRFISRSTDKCLPFYDLLRGNKKFVWGERCEEAFDQLKLYLTTPPVLAKPDKGDTLYLYVAVSTTAVSSILVKQDWEEKMPIFYTSKRMTDAETRYSTLEKMVLAMITSARKLRPYFKSHSIIILTNLPLRTIMQNANHSGRLSKWAVKLSEYDVTFQNRPAAKSQVLADFLIELTPDLDQDLTLPSEDWILHVDGSSSVKGFGIGIHLQSPTGELLQQSFRLDFSASNNKTEYESLIAGLRLVRVVQAKHVHTYCDSQLVANQFLGDYDAKNERMDAYLKILRDLAKEFESFQLTRIPRGENVLADALATLGSSPGDQVKRTIPIQHIDKPSITLYDKTGDHIAVIDTVEPMDTSEPTDQPEATPPYWRIPFIQFLSTGSLPTDKWEARRLKAKSSNYIVIDG
ncbi:hypothetical protein N665_0378s0007 [Sinapis alba]|nr:hypothetical protein N665_0378s0007 [Sinapis alba]